MDDFLTVQNEEVTKCFKLVNIFKPVKALVRVKSTCYKKYEVDVSGLIMGRKRIRES